MKPYFATTFADRTLRVWNLNQIANEGKGFEEAATIIPGAVELGPVDTQVMGSRVGCSSIDGSLKIFDFTEDSEGKL